jgi:hypothetical protein
MKWKKARELFEKSRQLYRVSKYNVVTGPYMFVHISGGSILTLKNGLRTAPKRCVLSTSYLDCNWFESHSQAEEFSIKIKNARLRGEA